MTDQAQGPNPEDAPAPPASTRWSEDPVRGDDTLAPPFVPGRSASATPEREAGGAGAAPPREPTTSDPEDDFPFDQFDIEGSEGEADEPAVAADSSADDMGWSPADLGDEEATAVDEESAGSAPAPEPEEPDSWSPPWSDVDQEAPSTEVSEAAEPLQPVPATEPAEPEAEAADEAAVEPETAVATEGVAAVLDRLAWTLREEGEEALRREMDSADRLTAVLAGVLTGYISGRS